MGVVNEVQQLDKNTEMTPDTLIRASYYIKEEISMLTLMMQGVEDVFLSIFIRELSTQNQNFFREKYLYLLTGFIENASIHDYSFFVFYQSPRETIAWFIVFFRCNHQSITMVKSLFFKKVRQIN
jgi:hypothetical protein